MSAAGTSTANHRIGYCPCCGANLYINVDLATEVGTPRLNSDGIAVASVRARITAAEIEHHCKADEDA